MVNRIGSLIDVRRPNWRLHFLLDFEAESAFWSSFSLDFNAQLVWSSFLVEASELAVLSSFSLDFEAESAVWSSFGGRIDGFIVFFAGF